MIKYGPSAMWAAGLLYPARAAHGIIASTALALHYLELIVVDNYTLSKKNLLLPIFSFVEQPLCSSNNFFL